MSELLQRSGYPLPREGDPTGHATMITIGACHAVWVLGNNAEHGRFGKTVPPPPPILDTVGGHEEAAKAPNDERVKRLLFHVTYVNWLAGGLLVAGISWGAVQILGT